MGLADDESLSSFPFDDTGHIIPIFPHTFCYYTMIAVWRPHLSRSRDSSFILSLFISFLGRVPSISIALFYLPFCIYGVSILCFIFLFFFRWMIGKEREDGLFHFPLCLAFPSFFVVHTLFFPSTFSVKFMWLWLIMLRFLFVYLFQGIGYGLRERGRYFMFLWEHELRTQENGLRRGNKREKILALIVRISTYWFEFLL